MSNFSLVLSNIPLFFYFVPNILLSIVCKKTLTMNYLSLLENLIVWHFSQLLEFPNLTVSWKQHFMELESLLNT